MVPGPGADGGVRCLYSDSAGNAADSGNQEDRAEMRGKRKPQILRLSSLEAAKMMQ